MPKNEILLFIVDDNREIQQLLTELAHERDWIVRNEETTARCIDEAVDRVNALSTSQDDQRVLIIIDVMLPKSSNDLAKLDKLVSLREAIINSRYDDVDDKYDDIHVDGIIEMKQRLATIDLQIRELIDLDGGIHFLEQVKAEVSGWKICIATAREMDDPQQSMKRKFGQSFTDDLRWLAKPATPDKIRNLLSKIEEEFDGQEIEAAG